MAALGTKTLCLFLMFSNFLWVFLSFSVQNLTEKRYIYIKTVEIVLENWEVTYFVFFWLPAEKPWEAKHSLVDFTGKNNWFSFLDILGYLKNTHKNPKFGKSQPGNSQPSFLIGTCLTLLNLGFYGYSLNTLKYPKMGICYFFPCLKRWLIDLKRPTLLEFLWLLSLTPIILRKLYLWLQHWFSRKLLEGWSSNSAKR